MPEQTLQMSAEDLLTQFATNSYCAFGIREYFERAEKTQTGNDYYYQLGRLASEMVVCKGMMDKIMEIIAV